ncbi:hypothetical protein OG331_31840 [Streptomyces sp. NBC_01017]|nr:hypothetical protein OG331_31840 [Streptomyces sp. NBC_01017]
MYAGITSAEALENVAAATADAHRWGMSYAELYGEQLVDQDEPEEPDFAR